MDEHDIRSVLRAGTQLVLDAAAGQVTLPEFVREYGNFYYYNALDGHEETPEGKQLLAKYADAVRLHARVQEEVVDLLYLGDESQKEAYIRAGRIDLSEASRRLEALAAEYRQTKDLLDEV